MRSFLYAAAVLAFGVFSAGASARHAGAAEDGPILPGYWESTSTASFPIASSKTERKCITGRAINAYLTGPVNNHYSCRYDTQDLRGGHADLDHVHAAGGGGKVAGQARVDGRLRRR